jgi:hypothetical protein
MRLNHSLTWTTIFSCNNLMKGRLIIILTIVLLQSTTSCNPGKGSLSTIISPTTSPTISYTITPTTIQSFTPLPSPTISPTFPSIPSPTKSSALTLIHSNITQWYIKLIYDISAADNPKSFLDLDAMEIVESPQSDLQYVVGGGSMVVEGLLPLNGARAKSIGDGNVNLVDCKGSEPFVEWDIPEIFTGNHICVISNENRLFLLRIEEGFNYPVNGIFSLLLFIKMDN